MIQPRPSPVEKVGPAFGLELLSRIVPQPLRLRCHKAPLPRRLQKPLPVRRRNVPAESQRPGRILARVPRYGRAARTVKRPQERPFAHDSYPRGLVVQRVEVLLHNAVALAARDADSALRGKNRSGFHRVSMRLVTEIGTTSLPLK